MRFLHLDVFTDTPYQGNQLAVFPEPRANLSAADMQAIAAEMAFSETTFVFPKEGTGDARMRIFTPAEELPIAGHPTIGTTFALASQGVITRGRTEFVFELGVGPTPVSLEWNDKGLAFAWMTQPVPTFLHEIRDRPALARAVGAQPEDLVDGLPVQALSNGVSFLYVPMRTRSAVDAVAIDRRALGDVMRREGGAELPVFFFTADRIGATCDETVYSRMLAPGFGITEDPATGSASGPLGAYLLKYGVVSAVQARSLLSAQGVAMGRPSRIHISIDSEGDRITRVRVGGTSVMVAEGRLIV
jgi:trans-2,3-dihydro-3-hydroxyanthranilate isomerase